MKVILKDDDGNEIAELDVYIATDGLISDNQKQAIEDRAFDMVKQAVEAGYR